MQKSSFIKNTIILTISNITTGTLNFIFFLTLSRNAGPKGVGLYQLVIPLYNLFLFITGGGITVTLSRVAAEKKAKGKLNELYKTVRIVCILEIFWALLITALLTIMAKFTAVNILGDARTYLGILSFCPAVIIISISSVFKGAYYGLMRIVEPAIIDIIEKIGRIITLNFFLSLFSSKGIEYKSASAVLALSVGELISLVLFYSCYKIYKRKHPSFGKSENSLQLAFNVIKPALPLGVNGILSTAFSTAIAVLIPRRLIASGILYEEALSLLGKVQGMAMTIIFYPAIIIVSFNVILIPSISEALAYKNNEMIYKSISNALKLTATVALSSFTIFFLIPDLLGDYFYKDPIVGELIFYLSLGAPLAYLEITSFAILNGLGKQINLLINSTIISISDIFFLYIFLGIPGLNIKGYAINYFISAVLGIYLNFRIIRKHLNLNFDYKSAFMLPLLSCIPSLIISSQLNKLIGPVPIKIATFYLVFLIILFTLDFINKNKLNKNYC